MVGEKIGDLEDTYKEEYLEHRERNVIYDIQLSCVFIEYYRKEIEKNREE